MQNEGQSMKHIWNPLLPATAGKTWFGNTFFLSGPSGEGAGEKGRTSVVMKNFSVVKMEGVLTVPLVYSGFCEGRESLFSKMKCAEKTWGKAPRSGCGISNR